MASENIESVEDFEATPEGQYKRWKDEMDASAKMLEDFHKQGEGVVKKYLDSREQGQKNEDHLNLFWSNVSTYQSMLFGNLPKIDVSRQYADPNDDVGRVAAEMIERVLTLDVEANGKEYTAVLKSVLQDRLLPGLGVARVRYEQETQQEEIPPIVLEDGTVAAEGYSKETLVFEAAPIDYYFWRDVRFSWTRNWTELRWIAFRNYMTKDECKVRFPECYEDFEYKAMKPTPDSSSKDDETDIWDKAEIWEIWDKSGANQIFWTDKYDKVIETHADPLKLKGFFPCPPFLMANTTTTLMVPKADYTFAEDQYCAIDELETRIGILTKAVRVMGFYDQANKELQDALNSGIENKMIAVENWAMLAEKGGIRGIVDWFPLEQVTAAITELTTQRDDKIALLYNVVGMADIMRGQGSAPGSRVTAEEQSLAASFGSVRVQALQEELARFCTDLMQLKAEVIARHYDPAHIVKLSNMKYSLEQEPLVMEAVKLIQNPDESNIRITIRPESVAMINYQQMQGERGDALEKMSVFLQSIGPMIEKAPETMTLWMSMVQWVMASYKGFDQLESVFDKAIADMTAKVQQQLQNPQPNPEQVKAEAAMKLDQQKHQGEMEKLTAKHQADMEAQKSEFQFTMQELIKKFENDMQLIAAKFETGMRTEEMQGISDIQSQDVDKRTEIELTNFEHEGDMELAETEHEFDMELLEQQAEVARAQMAARPENSEAD